MQYQNKTKNKNKQKNKIKQQQQNEKKPTNTGLQNTIVFPTSIFNLQICTHLISHRGIKIQLNLSNLGSIQSLYI